MKSSLCLSLALFSLLGVTVEARTWKQAATGREIEAELIKVENGQVHLQLATGGVGQVEIISLSLDDQQFVAEYEAGAAASSPGSAAGEWPNFRGPNHDGISSDSGLLDEWPDDGPPQIWINRDGGEGYSGIAVSGGNLYTLGTIDGDLTALCISVADGSKVWETSFGEDEGKGYNAGWGGGPRSTPSVSDGMVFVLGPNGELACLAADSGDKIWSKNLVDDFGGKAGGWGFSESPFIDGERLIIGPGGSDSAVVALEKKTGKTIWETSGLEVGGGKAEYATAVPATINGVAQYIRLFNDKVVSLKADDGSLVWSAEWAGGDTPAVIPTPIVKGNQVYVSSGYGTGSRLFEISSSNEATMLWESKSMKNKHGGVIALGEYLYGSSEAGGLVCQSWETGDLVWNEKGQFFGSTDSIAIADGMIYLLNDQSGTLSLVEATEDGFTQKGQFTMDPQSDARNSKGKVWTYPVIAGGKLFLKDQEIIIAYDVTAK